MTTVISSLLMLLSGPAPIPPAFLGSWVGTLQYRDFSDDSREKLGTLLRVYQPKASSGWVFRYVYDDGPKKVVQASDTVTLDWVKHQYLVASENGKEKDPYTFDATRLKPDGTGVMVLTGAGTENNVKVDIRETLTITPDHLDIVRESRVKGESFKFRHEFSFVRVDAK